MSKHILHNHIQVVREFLVGEKINFEELPTRWGIEFKAEEFRIVFKKRTCEMWAPEVNHQGLVGERYHEQLHEPKSPEEHAAFARELRIFCTAILYATKAREMTKAPYWIIFTVGIKGDSHAGEGDHRLRIHAYVRLNILGREPFHKYLAGEEYYVVNCDWYDSQSERVFTRHFSSMINALGSPIGSSYTNGHAPEAHGNFLEGGPFTFIPAKATIHTTSQYVLPEFEPETWDIFVLTKTHDVAIAAQPVQEEK